MSFSLESLEKNYKIEKELGKGGMGVVYLATDKRLERKVAIKVLSLSSGNSESSVSHDEVIERFKREAIAVAKLNHPNIVNIHDIGEENNLYYMVMEFVDGPTLSNIVEKTIDNPEMIINIGIQICAALESAHESGIIHRDIKPANIILSSKGTPKLMDFGIAQLEHKSEEDYKITQQGALLGSLMYISPEQLSNSSSIDARADIYSLGMTLYEMLTGKLPLMADNMKTVVMKVLTEDPPPPSYYNNKVSSELDSVILKSLHKEVNKRYQTAAEMSKDLSSILNNSFSGFSTQETMSRNPFMDTQINSLEAELMSQVNSLRATDSPSKILQGGSFINDALMKAMESDYSWIEYFTKDWKSYNIGDLGLNINQVFEQIINPPPKEQLFTGIILINNNIYITVHEGHFIGAVDTTRNIFNQEVFDYLPDEITSIRLKSPEAREKDAPAIISGILSKDKPFHINLDSASMDLLPLIDNFSSPLAPFTGYVKCYTQSNIYYYGFSAGKQVFAIPADQEENLIPYDDYKDLKNFVSNYSVLFNTYNLKPNIIGYSIKNIFKQASLALKYKEYSKAELSQICDFGADEVPSYLIKEVKNNLYLDLELNQSPKIKILDKDVELTKLIKESIYYKFIDWMLNDYFFTINSTNNTNNLRLIYTAIPYIEKFAFFENLKDESGKNHKLSIVVYGKPKGEHNRKILFLIKIGNNKNEEVLSFIDNMTEVKKTFLKTGDINSIFYIAREEYESDILKLYTEKVPEQKRSFLSLDSTSKYKGFIRMAYGKGFHVNLIEYSSDKDTFKQIAPIL